VAQLPPPIVRSNHKGHHESALAMARAVVNRAEHPEVRALAARIMANQQREIALLKRLQAQPAVPAIPSGDMAGVDMSGPGSMDQPGSLMGLPLAGKTNLAHCPCLLNHPTPFSAQHNLR